MQSIEYPSKMAASGLSKADYLKKYMEPERKKRKKKPSSGLAIKKGNFSIIDQDLGFKTVDQRKDSSDEEHEKPLVYAADGLSLLLNEEIEKKKAQAARWNPLQANTDTVTSTTASKAKENSTAQGNDSGSDYSPVRGRRAASPDSDSDYSPPRHRESSSDYSPPRRRRNDSDDSDDDNMQGQRAGNSKSSGRPTSGEPVKVKLEGSSSTKLPKKAAGLQTAAALREENKRQKKLKEEHFRRMDSAASGKGTKTVYRNKEGKIRDIELENEIKREIEEKKKEDDKVFKEWGKGVAQTKNLKERIQGDLKEMTKPLARYHDDQDLDDLLKSQIRSEDPMIAFLSKKTAKASSKKVKPRYKGPPPPPNRFNIWPGYRWDGVDRSNGFEKKRFALIANKKSTADEAYKWSVEDM